MKFNEKLLDLRKKKGLSQEELAQELNVSRQTISKWESGQSYPDFEKVIILSDFFDISLDNLMKERIPENKVNNTFTIDVYYLNLFFRYIIKFVTYFGYLIIIIILFALIVSFIMNGEFIQ